VLEVLLRPEIILSGRVIAAESGAPVADVPVITGEPHLLSYSGSFSTEPQVRTGEDGRFTFWGLGPGRYKPQVHAGSWRGQASESVLLVIGESPAPVEIKVYPARRVEGRLLRRESRTPCADGGIVVYDAAGSIVDRAQADAEGAIELGGLLPGPYDLELRCTQGEAPLAPLAVDLHGEDLLGALWEAGERSGRSIRGRVVDADGRGVAMAYVGGELRDPADPDDPSAQAAALAGSHAVTDADGAFEIHHLPPGGYEFYRIHAEGMAAPVDTPKVTLPSDRDVDDLVITLPRAGALQVRVQDSSGAPLTSASIKVSRVGGGGSNLQGMPDGVWKLDPTTPGIYQVKLHRPGVGGRAGPDDPSHDDPGEEIEVVPGRTATLTLVTARRDRTIRGVVQAAGSREQGSRRNRRSERNGRNRRNERDGGEVRTVFCVPCICLTCLHPSALRRAPSQPGVYEVALDRRRHNYPQGRSSTIYYGKSDTSIATRLAAHRSGRGNTVLRDHIAAKERLKVRWRRTSGARKTPRELECWHLDRFEANFGSRPLGNQRGCSTGDT